jgi:hypothetical protein
MFRILNLNLKLKETEALHKAASILLILLGISAAYGQQRIDYGEGPYGRLDRIRTELSPEKCSRTTTLRNKSFRVCPPVAGYQLLYGGDDARPEIVIVGPNRKQHLLQYWDLTSDNFIRLEKEVEWEIAHSRTGKVVPLAVLLEAVVKPNQFWRFGGRYTIGAKLTPSQVCVVRRVPYGPYESEDIGAVRDSAPNLKCIPLDNIGRKDWLGVVYGLTAAGRFEEAKATLKEIISPPRRIVAYLDIARGEAGSGRRENARATLLRAWDEALNQKVQTNFFDEYGRENQESRRDDDQVDVIRTMTALGFDDDAYERLKLVRQKELSQLLVVMGKAQGLPDNVGGRGDRATANATLMRAIKLEQSRADTIKADGILFDILDAQLEIGLFDEARQTVLLIKGPMTRQAAEYTLSVRAPRQ